MGAAGNRTRTEMRKKPRRPFHYNAQVWTDQTEPLLPCLISNVSESGARIAFEGGVETPDHFVLLLTATGRTRRQCEVVWRNGTTVGVKFSVDHA